MPLPVEAPHSLPSASGPNSPLPSCKQTAPLSPLFASLTKSAHPIDSTSLTRPLFSTTCALFRALCQERNPISFPFNRFRTLARKHPGVGVAASLVKGGGVPLSPLEPILTQKQGEGVGVLARTSLRFPYWHLSKADCARRIDLAVARHESGSAPRTHR